MTQTRTALVSTDAPARYAKQLASHLGRKMTVEETAQGPRLTMDFDGQVASCQLDTTANGTLRMRAASDSEAALERMAQVVGSHLERFGAKAELRVSWTA
ncbi:DUF2218 domain-containing protein [Ornithinimicrobium avium]|uniref:DUF2218 domain-containing protein n=1 Tax=Ornithinimicrobium avium TaxID=2283195 RepID=A0A345NK15_9MICO|nr:DUF2218 domain-containing protein [Ornithinimicrobium avium]AXH95373.1 DUF2218 domain-containing protein [Ornithinimicrobium avium]